ncbi:hypothetical protein CR513_04519, partial [Mucuna pruriens]
MDEDTKDAPNIIRKEMPRSHYTFALPTGNTIPKLFQEGEMDPMAILDSIDDILGMTLAFKIKVQLAYKCSSMVHLSEDEKLIEEIVQKLLYIKILKFSV